MFQFLPFRHLARDQAASAVFKPFKELPISSEFRAAVLAVLPKLLALSKLQNGAVSVLRPKILFCLGNKSTL